MRRRLVILINPRNSSSASDQGIEHSDWANYAHAGILTLATAANVAGLETLYFDEVVCPRNTILDFLADHSDEILAVGISLLTANYISGLELFAYIKHVDPSITTVAGNDHFTALSKTIFENQHAIIDCGFVGNEVVGGFTELMCRLKEGASPEKLKLPGLITKMHQNPMNSNLERVIGSVDYGLIDKVFDHTSLYTQNFQSRIAPEVARACGLAPTRGVPVELGRGCIKFRGNDACSFCSIQYGQMWKNQVESTSVAIEKMRQAIAAGYDYLYVTADELPLTFSGLLHEMQLSGLYRNLKGLSKSEDLVLAGYSRADGLATKTNVHRLRELGFRVLMVGVDAGSPLSLRALNKPIARGNMADSAQELFAANMAALSNAAIAGISLRLGFVLGHVGMTQELLDESVEFAIGLITSNPTAILSVDVELLSPEPGSAEFQYLLQPQKARELAKVLGLKISSIPDRTNVAAKWQARDIIDRQELIADYRRMLMPEITESALIQARRTIRDSALKCGVLIGQG